MGFRLVPKSVTLNDLERCNGHYFALFRGIRYISWPVSYKWLISCRRRYLQTHVHVR